MGNREAAVAFVEGYGATWQAWDFDRWVDLFSDDVLYVEHPTNNTVVGREALGAYVRHEASQQGEVTVRMGSPVIDGDRVAGEFWVTGENSTLTGGFIARLAPDGRCTHFREYWFFDEGRAEPFDWWGD